jgi:AcrR family transcriptional regulator
MPRGDRSIATREALLAAAARAFTRRGRYGATVRAIAHEAGVTVPAIYYHFEGTDQLYETVLREGRARFREMAEAAAAEPGEPELRLRRLARTYTRFGREDPTFLRLLCMNLFGPLETTSVDEGAVELRGWTERRIEDIVGELLGAPREATQRFARLFLALMSGLLVEQARDPETALLDDAVADRAVDLFLRGLPARSDLRSAGKLTGRAVRRAAVAEDRR